jgi:hypothetical protein
MISWMFLLVTSALVAGVFGLGTLAAAFEIVIAVTAVLAVIGWATAGGSTAVSPGARGQRSSARPRRVAT